MGRTGPPIGIVQSVQKPQSISMQRAELPETAELDRLLDAALAEDLGRGDVTSEPLFAGERNVPVAGRLVAKAHGVLAGIEVFRRAFARLDAGVEVKALVEDGSLLQPGDVVCELAGPARPLLSAERTALIEKMRDMVMADTAFIGAMARTRFYVVNPWLRNYKPDETFYNWVKYMDVDESKRPN